MAKDVILPALGIAQDTGKVVRWIKAEGEQVTKGEPLAEIETDKAIVELEAPADGFLASITAVPGEDIPVGQVIAAILSPDEWSQRQAAGSSEQTGLAPTTPPKHESQDGADRTRSVAISPLAARMATEHNLDLNALESGGKRIQKADVLLYLQQQEQEEQAQPALTQTRLAPASPKARRLAREQSKDLAAIKGSGPGGAVLTADVLATATPAPAPTMETPTLAPEAPPAPASSISNIWRIMAERTTQSWTSVPHFYLVREVNASRLIAWHDFLKQQGEHATYTDLLVKIVSATLLLHQRLNAWWDKGVLTPHTEVHIGLAVAVEQGLVVPVIHQAHTLSLHELVHQREELVTKAQAGKLRPADIQGGTFSISNLGMYGVDAFDAIIHQPQVAILAVGRIAERVVPINGQPAIQPMMVLTLSCDHRAVDGASGAQFLNTLALLIEEPLGLLG